MTLLRITGPGFVAGAVADDSGIIVRAAPMVSHLIGMHENVVRNTKLAEGFTVEAKPGDTPVGEGWVVL